MPLHPDGADVPMRNPASARETTKARRNIEGHFAEVIRAKKVVGTSQVLAEDGPGRAFVVTARILGPKPRILELLVIGVT